MIKVISALILALFLTACGGGDSTPPPRPPQPVVQLTMDPNSWNFEHSPNMGIHPTAHPGGWYFEFPSSDGVHYLTQRFSGSLGSALNVTFLVDKTADTVLHEVDTSCGSDNPMVRLYFQRTGDNLSAQGIYEFYRFWSEPRSLNSTEPQAFSIDLSPEKWSSVLGQSGSVNPDMFYAAVKDVQAVGMTFGGCSGGHGVYSNGSAQFIVTEFK